MAAVLLPILLGSLPTGSAEAKDGFYVTATAIGSLAKTNDAENEGTLGGNTTNPDHSDEVAGIGGALGYEATAGIGKLRAEIEIHYRFRFDFDENRPIIDNALPLAGLDSNLATTTGLVNLNYRLDPGFPLDPYLVVGLGATYYHSDNEFNDFGGLGRSTEVSTGTNFTWAINAGLLWQASEHVEMVFGYRYIDMGKIEFGSFAGDGIEVSADYVSHDITIGLSYRF
jgi:opacity protein-like surface antigen